MLGFAARVEQGQTHHRIIKIFGGAAPARTNSYSSLWDNQGRGLHDTHPVALTRLQLRHGAVG